ncbi:MAG TPA: FAD-binding oxidoreductase [Rhodothermales bacterium]|nr:FAD-binding oxidoreductase [Rhodothermales bacterium]
MTPDAPPGPLSAEALAAFAEAVGAAYVDASPEAREGAATATFETTHRVAAVVRPADRAEVQACVGVARRFGLVLYPVSRGRNWGYGSRVPTADGAVVLSLDRMQRVTGYDERGGAVTVEPGVSFGQLADFLRERGSKLYLAAPGSTPDASVVGNALERGLVQGPQPDRALHVGAFEVVLADGSCVHTGAAAFPESRVAHLHRWGLGPALDGLFVQSNLGIVTAMTVWLQPVPAFHRHVHFTLPDDTALPAAVDALQRLRMEGTVTTSIALHLDSKVLSLLLPYPYAATSGRTPLPDDVRQRLADAVGGGRWFGECAIGAPTAAVLDVLSSRLEEVLGPVVPALRLTEVNAEGPFYSADAESGLAHAYWRKRSPMPPDADPDRDRCGILWVTALLPFEGESAVEGVRLVEKVLPSYGFDPLLTFQAADARCLHAIVSLVYDRDEAGADGRALDAYHALADAFTGAGFPPHRLALPGQARPPAGDPAYGALVRTLKKALDPDGLLAPGRYDAGAPGA